MFSFNDEKLNLEHVRWSLTMKKKLRLTITMLMQISDKKKESK